ncbi:hypothetical protein GE061_003878 [Apolygus lucorum]|uniref:MADF domain-containing protein n=1 Tax=Apolygus lucorum TaxID=248454 RepID=A0A8S9WXN8_APOLU|nr:hypothetical protein GE061_003878 [Apolygus lucorum]
MDIEKLINGVQQRPALWDQKNRFYHNRDVVRRSWNEVAEECEAEGGYKKKPPIKDKGYAGESVFVIYLDFQVKKRRIPTTMSCRVERKRIPSDVKDLEECRPRGQYGWTSTTNYQYLHGDSGPGKNQFRETESRKFPGSVSRGIEPESASEGTLVECVMRKTRYRPSNNRRVIVVNSLTTAAGTHAGDLEDELQGLYSNRWRL